ncbi:MAG: hypothetical protein GEV09_00240 [Pseudonocardiaceae bacterium]|nr:hypothetical protein [Pseudonocardiaceae bacterium]
MAPVRASRGHLSVWASRLTRSAFAQFSSPCRCPLRSSREPNGGTARDNGSVVTNKTRAWCEVHHIHPWEDGGETKLSNCVMLCKLHHRLTHHSGWTVRIRDGLPEFVPPAWIDPDRQPRRRPLPHLAA